MFVCYFVDEVPLFVCIAMVLWWSNYNHIIHTDNQSLSYEIINARKKETINIQYYYDNDYWWCVMIVININKIEHFDYFICPYICNAGILVGII